ncbi:gamma-glutamyltransferase family protein [Streptomyces sp. TP-A0874]|uniref:gamma-glutamyltransferase family protein n=1 Tax=Streptomyces sp. TP-A0874 TaxID=549819 RepID=UPI000B2EE2CE|nr:gamma-glutamyltransferase [Streptomyces sp. TP-A0874]
MTLPNQNTGSNGGGGAAPAGIAGSPRSSVLAAEGMAASSHPAVTLAGVRTLADGGNAVDAALAMAAVSWSALPGQCGVGGDAFAIVHEPDGRVWTVNGSGFGPDGGSPSFYTEQGLASVPIHGPLSVAVPGCLAALHRLHTESGSRPLPELWAPGVRAAQLGIPCTPKTCGDIAGTQDALAVDPTAAHRLLPGGRPPHLGQRLGNPELAATIAELAADPASFYTGSFAERAVAALREQGAPFSGDEWQLAGDCPPLPAVEGRYRGRTVYQTPLPTPGWMMLQQAAICDGRLGRLPWLGTAAVHLLASAARIAFADRLERCGSDSDAWRECLSPAAIAEAGERISTGAVPTGFAGAADGDTTSMVAVDGEGRAVGLIHSLAFTFGARVSLPGTGVILNNRLGRGSYLIPGHPNEVQPRRRPLHTLNAWLVTDGSGRLEHIGNTPGGDGQVQWNTQLLSHLVDHGLAPQAAVEAPRFTVHPGSDADVLGQPEELRCESRLGEEVLDGLRALGHRVRRTGPWEGGGSAVVVSADQERGCLLGGADPRLDGVALGL